MKRNKKTKKEMQTRIQEIMSIDLMEKYVSIIVPYFNRPHYLRELIDSVHKYADMPFELIVHDDASVDGSTPEVFNMRDKMSSLIINNGHNLGISASTNILVNMASSDYIIFLNDDCAFVNYCLNNILDILSRPYIGYLHLTGATNPDINIGEPKITLVGIQSGSALAFRKSVWKEIGGWNKDIPSGSSDVAFMTTVFKNGYFAATPYGKQYVINLSYARKGNSDSSMTMSGYDCSYHKIFNLKEKSYDEYCKMKETNCGIVRSWFEKAPEGMVNLSYWCEYTTKLLYTKPGNTIAERIDWEIAKGHGHDRWRDQIGSDNILKY